MISVDIPITPFIVGEIIIGIIACAIWDDFPKIVSGLTVVGFILGIFVFAFSNPTALNDFNALNDKITYIVIALVNMLLHSVFFDLGAGIVQIIRHPPRQ